MWAINPTLKTFLENKDESEAPAWKRREPEEKVGGAIGRQLGGAKARRPQVGKCLHETQCFVQRIRAFKESALWQMDPKLEDTVHMELQFLLGPCGLQVP